MNADPMVPSPPRDLRSPRHRRRFPAAARALGFVLVLLAGRAAPGEAQQRLDTDPNPHGRLATPCATCHTADGWTPARIDRRFDHNRTGFPLAASHAAVACTTCHTSLEFRNAPSACAACHQDVHQGELGTDCAQCHNLRAFNDRAPMAQAHALTRFPLDGAHRDVDCQACHRAAGGGQLMFKGAPTGCVACHQADYARTATPPHQAAGFPTDCTTCHTNLDLAGGAVRPRYDASSRSPAPIGAHVLPGLPRDGDLHTARPRPA